MVTEGTTQVSLLGTPALTCNLQTSQTPQTF